MTTMPESRQTAVLGGGCFWCLEAVFDQLAGVQSVESGYAGGRTANPTYEAVCSGAPGMPRSSGSRFDPAVLSFRDLLRVFFSIHDPTTRDRQGNDIGTQYRSVIFCQTPEQKSDAEAVIAELTRDGIWPAPIVTEIAGAATFYPAESYHQEYFERNGRQPYCQAVVAPKVAKFRKQFVDRAEALARSGRRANQPPPASAAPTDQNTGASPSVDPTAPNTSGTANVEALMIDMRTPAASPILPGRRDAVQQRHHHRLRAAERQPQRERQDHQRAGARHEREQRIGGGGDEQRRRQHLEFGEAPRDPRHHQAHDERRRGERREDDADA